MYKIYILCILYIYINVIYIYMCFIYIYIYVGWNYKALHHKHHIRTRCASYINRYKDRCKERHMHAYIRPKHACTRACRHKGSPLSFIMLPLCIAMRHLDTYIQTNKDASIDENINADYRNMHKYVRRILIKTRMHNKNTKYR